MISVKICFASLFVVTVAHLDLDSSCDSYEDSSEYGGGHGHHHGGYKRPNQGCGNGWIGFNRPNGRWCLKVFAGHVEQPLAEEKCGEYQATLSAFMNSQEQSAVNSDALSVMSDSTGCIWLGLKRTQPCLKQRLNAQCTPENSFYYTDGSTTGTAGLIWDRSQNQPDNAYGHTQACATYFVAKTGGQPVVGTGRTWLTQRLDDTMCDLTPKSGNDVGSRRIVGYLCGRRAE